MCLCVGGGGDLPPPDNSFREDTRRVLNMRPGGALTGGVPLNSCAALVRADRWAWAPINDADLTSALVLVSRLKLNATKMARQVGASRVG